MRKNELILSSEEIAAGVERIGYELLMTGIRCKPGCIGYETVYTDETGSTQGGWYAEFDKDSRDKLAKAKQKHWHNIGMISGDTLDDILAVIRRLTFRNYVKEPSELKMKMANDIKSQILSVQKALAEYNSTASLSDQALRLCLTHFYTLDKLVQADPMLSLVRPYVEANLHTLQSYKEERSKKH